MKGVTNRFFLTETANLKTIVASNCTLEVDGIVVGYVTLLCCDGFRCFFLVHVICDL